MRLILDRALFAPQSNSEALALVRLLATAAEDDKRHALLTDPAYLLGGANQEIDTWLSGRPRTEGDAFRNVLTTGNVIAAVSRSAPSADPKATPRRWYFPGTLEFRVERRVSSDWGNLRLTLADALDLMREPVHLVLENDRTDRSFVCHLAGPTDGPALRRLLSEPGRIQVHGGGGGGQAKKWIQDLTSGAKTADNWRRVLRAWVLFDQDSGDPDARAPSKSAMELMTACEQVVNAYRVGPAWICLCRREIESYVPDAGLQAEALHAHAALVQKVIAWRADPALAPYAWAFDLKLGLRGDLRASVSAVDRATIKDGKLAIAAPMLKPPFDTLTPAEVAALGSGLGDRLGKALLRTNPVPHWAADLPAEYDRGPSDQAPQALFVKSLFDRI